MLSGFRPVPSGFLDDLTDDDFAQITPIGTE